MTYSGDIALGKTLYVNFDTLLNNVLTTLAGSPVISAYPDGSTTEITGGITLTVDFDGRTGSHLVTIVATSGNGYATGTDYCLRITTGTVGGLTAVGRIVGSFSIEKRSALRPTTADRTLDVSATGEGGVDWGNVGSPTTANGLTGTTIATSQVVASVTGAVGSVTGAVGSVTGAVGSVTGNVGGNVTGSVGSVTGNVGGNVVGSVGSVAGAVASVTGNVGGNVTGSVGSVVGAVGSVTGAVGSVTGNVGGNVVGSVGSVAGAVASVTATVNADVKKINGTTVNGDGSVTPWGP